MTDKETARKEIKRLSGEIEGHNYKYYVLNEPSISDKEYDDLLKKLIELESRYPDLVDPNSPTQRVGTKITIAAMTLEHRTKIYSLDNTYSIEELTKWHERVVKGLGQKDVSYMVELKIDGLSASLVYEKGEFVRGATRGDGLTGEDVTHCLKTIRSIPLKLKAARMRIPDVLDVRGEIYMDRSDFEAINKERKKLEEPLFANPRNAAAGSVKLLDSRITAKRNLKCFIHSFGTIEGIQDFRSQEEFLSQCHDWGFSTNKESQLCRSINEVVQFCQSAEKKREQLPFEVDGAVIKVNDLTSQRKLGETLKSPRWAVAFKFQAHQATTIIEDIVVQVGRTGVLTPVAQLKPVACGGVTISRATLHNFDEIKRLNVKVGDRVLIERAGDVIPKIMQVVEHNKKRNKPFSVPRKCPQCGSPVVKDEQEVAYRCENPSCTKQLERRLIHFASRGAMDIEGLGESVIKQLLEKKMVSDLAGIYFLKEQELLTLDLFAQKKAKNLIEAIEKSKKQPLSRFIYGLGIMHVGEKVASVLARKFSTLKELMKATVDELNAIPEVGEAIARSVENSFRLEATKKLIEKFEKVGINFREPQKQRTSNKFENKKFVFTGEMSFFTRELASDLVRSMGADVISSVSKNTDYLVVGDAPGSKFKKAKSLGVKILNENQFKELIDA